MFRSASSPVDTEDKYYFFEATIAFPHSMNIACGSSDLSPFGNFTAPVCLD